jgi:hypothetical protein
MGQFPAEISWRKLEDGKGLKAAIKSRKHEAKYKKHAQNTRGT